MLADARQQRLIIGGAAGEDDEDELPAIGQLEVGGVVANFAGVACF